MLIGTTEAAERCGVDRSTFFRWYQLNRIQPVRQFAGRTGALVWESADVDALIEENERRKKHGACPNCRPASWHTTPEDCPEYQAEAAS